MSKAKVVFNPGTSPVVIDEEGRMAHPGDWTPVLENDALSKALASGAIYDRTEDITDKSNRDAFDALQRAKAMEKAEANKPPADPRPADTMSTEDASSEKADSKPAAK